MQICRFLFTITLFAAIGPPLRGAEWKPAAGPLTTRWAKDVDPTSPHRDYPRPQMVRPGWQNLNGLWEYAIRPNGDTAPAAYDGRILVPFCVESQLSGVMRNVGVEKTLWYRRAFHSGNVGKNQRVLLHFGAVDWEAEVWVNDTRLGTHRGGYDPFTFDITSALHGDGGNDQQLVVRVWDPTDHGPQPRGKQIERPQGIWYEPVTGIWQTVWLEVVPTMYVRALKIVPDIDEGVVRVRAVVDRPPEQARIALTASLGDDTFSASGRPNEPIVLPIDHAKLWSPAEPHLYALKVALSTGETPVDTVTSYLGMRKIRVGADRRGVVRLMLNNRPLFQFGPLDQGWWPDGLYTAPTDAALRSDIERTKRLGFNMIRKHVKVEPARWYYHCDQLGMLVWQDMPSGDRSAKWDPVGTHDNREIERTKQSAAIYRRELKAMIDARRNHPSIVCWVPFNEAWGQFDTVGICRWIEAYDPTRLVNCASGGNDFPVGDIRDVHRYPGPVAPPNEPQRAAVLGEFGGLGLPVPGHLWQEKKNWGYRKYKNEAELFTAYTGLLDKLQPLIRNGLAAAVYTQTTDVESEVNGLMTYDRAHLKVDPRRTAARNRRLYEASPRE